MKTRLFLAAAIMMVMAAASPAVAQQTGDGKQAVTRVVKGAVIDKNGNPIPGATVRATGGAEVTVTDADGTYSLEVPVWLKSLTASYTGMMDKKLKLTTAGTTIFTLKPERGHTYGFINLVGTQVWQVSPKAKGIPTQTQLGLMGGAYRNWGGYLKAVMKLPGGRVKNVRYAYDDEFGYEPTVTFGAIKRLSKNFNILFGAGVAFNYGVDGYEREYDDNAYYDAYNKFHEQYYQWQQNPSGSAPIEPSLDDFKLAHPEFTPEYAETNVTGALELGAMYHTGKFNVTAGITYIFPGEWSNNKGNIAGWLGIGYHF